MMIMKVFTTHLNQNLMIKMINIKKQQNDNINTKPPNVFNYLKILSQKAEHLRDEIEDAEMISTMVSFYLLVLIRKNVTLILLGSH